MPGIDKLSKILLGRETTAGTEADATTYWRGKGYIKDNSEKVFPEENIGYLSGINRVYTPKVEAQLDLAETEATFEGVLHLFEAGIHTATTATTGGGVQYPYTFLTTGQGYLDPSTGTNSVKSYTVEGGNNQQEEQFLFGYCPSFKLAGEAGAAVMMSGTLMGRQVATGTFTTNPTLPSVETILMSKGQIYIDTVGGTIGNSNKAGTFLKFSLDVDTGWRARYTADGQLYFYFIKNVGPVITCDFTFEHETTAVAEIAKYKADTPGQIRLKWTGAALTTTGTSYSYKTLLIDMAGSYQGFDPLDEEDGNSIVTGSFKCQYDSTAALFCEIIDVVNITSVP